MPAGEVLRDVGSSLSGLTEQEAADRVQRFGPNRLAQRESTSAFAILLEQFRSPLILLLIAAAAVLVAVGVVEDERGELINAALITAIVLFNAGLGFTQNYRADRGIEALRRLSEPQCTVLRDGEPVTAPAAVLVPGDVVALEEGDRVPADGRVLSAASLVVDESALTGESVSVVKGAEPVGSDAVLAERHSMAYAGTVVVGGRGRFVVTATATRTQVGRIAEQIQAVEEEPTRFQREVGRLGVRIGWVVGFLVILIAIVQTFTSDLTVFETMLAAVALAVAAIPEGLPVVLSLALAFGTREMLARNALVRSLPIVEIVGSATVICTDKTGTVTEGRMTTRVLATAHERVATGPEEDLSQLVDTNGPGRAFALATLAAGLCNNARPHPELGYTGDPTEVALLEMTHRAGADLTPYERLSEVPFSSERRMMSVVVAGPSGTQLFAKGAFEAILPRCTHVLVEDDLLPLTEERAGLLEEANRKLADGALRVLALARRPVTDGAGADAETGLEFLALAGISDPPRVEAAQAIRLARQAGIRVVMITGDNRVTAAAIAADVGLDGPVTEARVLDQLAPDEIRHTVETHAVFARAEPRHKVTVLRALKEGNNVVIMTGDGVNDGPALKNADVGIAMGVRGTDVARDASDMVLMDDNFATIVAAVSEGRRILRNIKKFVTYLLAGNLAEVAVLFIGSLFGYLPVTAVQILWVNLVTDSGPSIALGVDPPIEGEMRHPPRPGTVPSRTMVTLVGTVGSVMTAVILGSFFFALERWDLETARTVAFTSLVLLEYVKLVVLRLQEGTSLFANRLLLLAVLASLLLQLTLIYTPLGEAFGVVELGVGPWLVLLAGLVAGFAVSTVLTRTIEGRLGPL